MDTSYRELKSKDVVNVTDGRNLGRTCDIVFSFPEGKVYGIVVPGKRGFHFFKNNDLFIALKNVVKIGTDVVLGEGAVFAFQAGQASSAENGVELTGALRLN